MQLVAWLTALSGLGHRCGVLTGAGANDCAGSQSICELVETYDPKRGLKVLKHVYLRIPSLLAAARAWHPDVVVQSIGSLETGVMAFLGGRLGVPFVHRVASDAHVDERSRNVLGYYERLAYGFGARRADLIVCQNEYQTSRLRQKWPRARLHTQPNIFHPAPGPSSFHCRKDRAYVAWLGLFRKEKNLPLLHAIAETLRSIEFRIAGMALAGIDADSAASLARLRELPNVRFVGYLKRAEVAGFLAGATALVCTSDYEGFPNTFLEALAAGTPVVTRDGVDPDSIIAGHALGRVAIHDDRFAGCIREIHEMPAVRFDELSRRCRHYVETHHAPEPVMRSFVEAVRPLVQTAARR